jgi:hypothetical protein
LLGLPPLSCSALSGANSQPGLPLAQTVFQNNSGITVRVYKLETSGSFTLVATLNNGQSSAQLLAPPQTYYKVTDTAGVCRVVFLSQVGIHTAVIN